MEWGSKVKKKKLLIKLSGFEAEYAQLSTIFDRAEEMPFRYISEIGDLARKIGELKAEIKLLEKE